MRAISSSASSLRSAASPEKQRAILVPARYVRRDDDAVGGLTQMGWGGISGWKRPWAGAVAGALVLATVTLVGRLLALPLPAASFAFLSAIVLISLVAPRAVAIVFAGLAALCLNYFFADPLFTLRIGAAQDIWALAGFMLAAGVITALVRRTSTLADAQSDLAELLHLSRHPVLVRDRGDHITFWNSGAEELYGWSAGEAVGRRVHDLLKTKFPQPLEDIGRELEETGRWQGELVHAARNGRLVTVHSRWSVRRGVGGQADAILEANDDITETRAAERLFKASQSVSLAAAQALTQTGSIAWNTVTGELQWSEETYRICGIDRTAPLTGQVIQSIVHPDDAAGYQAAVQSAIRDKSRFDRIVRIVRPDGEERVLHMVGRFLEEKPEQFVGALSDITQRRKDEEALRNSEFHYRNMFAAMAASFWELDFSGVTPILKDLFKQGVKDLEGHLADNPDIVRQMMRATRVIDVNDQTIALFGRGDKAEMLDNVEPYWADASLQVYARSVVASIGKARGFSAETRFRRLDGTEFDGLFTVSFPPQGVAASKFLIAVIDISERVNAQGALRRLQGDFAHAARLSTLGELAASIAHEVNQPLGAITTNASASLRWLDRPEPNLEEVKILAARIAADARRAADIITRIRGMATRQAAESLPLSMTSVIEEATAFLRHDMQAQGVSVRLQLPPDLPPVLGDRTQLQQVVVNLAMNAAQALASLPPAQRHVVIGAHLEGDHVAVTVDDEGPGIAAEHFDRLFQSFFTTKENGMGIGLPICRTIVEAHGGQLRAENRTAGGARFSFSIPAHRSS